jgi:hypothetical protein
MCIIWTNKRFDFVKMHGATVKKKSNVDLPSLRMKVPDHVYVSG